MRLLPAAYTFESPCLLEEQSTPVLAKHSQEFES